jgi:hypothetical protein
VDQLTIAVIAAFGGAIIVTGVYHWLVLGPRLGRLTAVLGTHDGLLGGGAAGPATKRLDVLEANAAAATATAAALAARVDALEKIARGETPRVGFVRYNAFDDVGSDLSYALALITPEGDGVVLSSIYSREETRTYGKAVTNFQSAQDASSEELAAIAKAKAAAT